ncbi:hypothetical protein H8S20_06505 [Clostridium sp. NSJ-6]|uniref:Uncharacterized protein n=1 Tax=Clostridium hominis TaxID=2763036 RepID=A0ABR7DCF3_9CLOT|nr:hypothetical protein [Clostridium hominis]MBC5628548.1 hypothetical protein [Clostridium hominis]
MLIRKIYTSLDDFSEGILSPELNYSNSENKLHLLNKDITFPFIWIPNNNGTVSKINSLTGEEIARYIVWPSKDKATLYNGPSRTAIDLDGNCWVANRGLGTIVKIGSKENLQFEDRNKNGICDTCIDLNNNGIIDDNEVLPWGEDECVLKEILLFGDNPGAYIPGTYSKEYSNSIFPRALAIDKNNNLWVGAYDLKKYYKIDCITGSILSVIDLNDWNHHPYGAVVDKYGFLWSSSGPSEEKNLIKIDTNKEIVVSKISNLQELTPYCLALDKFDHLFISGWTSNKLARLNIINNNLDWVYSDSKNLNNSRGITCTSDGDVWIANSGNNTVARYSNNGNFIISIPAAKNPTALSVDNMGNIWVCGLTDEKIYMIDSLANTINLVKDIPNSDGHNAYSDMTGIISRTITNKIGRWTVIYDSKSINTLWEKISWDSEEPTGTLITVKVRTSIDKINWSNWKLISNNSSLKSILPGRFLHIEATFKIISGNISPSLSKIIIGLMNAPAKEELTSTSNILNSYDLSLHSESERIIDINSDVLSITNKDNNNYINPQDQNDKTSMSSNLPSNKKIKPTRGIIF